MGQIPDVAIAAQLDLSGQWVESPRFGRQFKVKDCSVQLPTQTLGIEKFLGQGFAKGVGEGTAKKIVELFGEKTLHILDNDPQQLLTVRGISEAKLEIILKAWMDLREYSLIIIPLMNLGISKILAHRIYKKYGQEAFEVIKKNPYLLIHDLWGVGFLRADDIARRSGILSNSSARISAAINHILQSNLETGSLYFEQKMFMKAAESLLSLDDDDGSLVDLITENLNRMILENDICKIVSGEAVLLTPYKVFAAENELAKMILAMQGQEVDISAFNIPAILRDLQNQEGAQLKIILSQEQQESICTALSNRITIVTGGPGTGKTTLLKSFLQILRKHNKTFLLAAPTGRAAKRMHQATNSFAQTLHRLLEVDPVTKKFVKNMNNKISTDFLIIDEFSMVDLFLANAILRATCPRTTQLVFVGDVDQLPSVGPGKILGDLIGSCKVKTISLTRIFRQECGSLITENAHRVNSGQFPISQAVDLKKDFYYSKIDDPADFAEFLQKCYSQVFPKHQISIEDTIVLTPMHKGVVGSLSINNQLQDILNHKNKEFVMVGQQRFKIGDPVMQRKNNYDKSVFNGDIGKVASIKRFEGQTELGVNFDGRIVFYKGLELNELSLAYAISIHKSQGSEFGAVIIPIYTQHFMMLNRNVLYTAITRARSLCLLVGQTKAVAISVKNCQPDNRITLLQEMLQGLGAF